ncbi:MAG TPA: hypothetical protein VF095_05290 [Bacillota bacterium]
MNRLVFFGLIVVLFIAGGCSGPSNKEGNASDDIQETLAEEQQAIAEEQASLNDVSVFDLSVKDVYATFKDSHDLKADMNKDKSAATFTGKEQAIEIYVDNHHDEKIDSFFVTITNPQFDKNNKQLEEVQNSFKGIFELLNVKYDEAELFTILKTDVTKNRKNKLDSFPEDLHISPYDSVWIGIEGIYNSNNEPKPSSLEVLIFPTEPEGYGESD